MRQLPLNANFDVLLEATTLSIQFSPLRCFQRQEISRLCAATSRNEVMETVILEKTIIKLLDLLKLGAKGIYWHKVYTSPQQKRRQVIYIYIRILFCMIGIDTTKNWKDPGNSPRLGSLLALGFGEAGADIIGVLELQPGLGKPKKPRKKDRKNRKLVNSWVIFVYFRSHFFKGLGLLGGNRVRNLNKGGERIRFPTKGTWCFGPFPLAQNNTRFLNQSKVDDKITKESSDLVDGRMVYPYPLNP